MAGTGNIPAPIQQECPVCQAPVKRYTFAQAGYFGCGKCRNFFKISKKGELQRTKLTPKTNKIDVDPFLVPGKRGKFNGIEYLLVGRAVKGDKAATQFKWREYILFNPLHGYLWLSEYDGHWLLMESLEGMPENHSDTSLYYSTDSYRLFQKYRATVFYAEGEFPDYIYSSNTKYEEYVSPPHLIAHESDSHFSEWYLGTYMQPEDVAAAFNLSAGQMPSTVGVGAAQPYRGRYSSNALRALCIGVGVLMVLLQIIFTSSAKERVVVDMEETVSDSLAGSTIASKPFTLTGLPSNLEFSFYSDVTNNWADADILLVDEKTNEPRGVSIGSEYYSGYDDEGSWSEGQRTNSTILSSVAAGTYHINVKPSHGHEGQGGNHFHLTVTNDVPVFSNLFVLLLLLIAFLLFHFWRRNRFEKRRWENSDYSPYSYDDE